MKYCITGTTNKEIISRMEHYGYRCVSPAVSADVSMPISTHADVLYLRTGHRDISVSVCQQKNIPFLQSLGYTVKTVKLNAGYTTECRLNMVITDDTVIFNPATSVDISELCNNKTQIKVRQGYTRCSTAVAGKGFITEDKGIYNALVKAGKNVLLIKKGFVALDGYDCGFIGGATAYLEDEKILLFFGDITQHPDYDNICIFCHSQDVKTEYISDMALYDYGGAVFI